MEKESTVVWKLRGGTCRLENDSLLSLRAGKWMCRRGYRNGANSDASPVSNDVRIRDFLNQGQYHLYQEAIHDFFPPLISYCISSLVKWMT